MNVQKLGSLPALRAKSTGRTGLVTPCVLEHSPALTLQELDLINPLLLSFLCCI